MINYDGKQWLIEKPTPYNFLLATDFVENDEIAAKLKSNAFVGAYLVFTCIVDDTGESLSDSEDFESFIKTLSLEDFRRLQDEMKNFQNQLAAIQNKEKDQDG